MTTDNPLPVELTEPITLEAPESRVDLIGVTGLVVALLAALVGIVVLAALDQSVPDALNTVAGVAGGALAMRLRGDRP